MAAPTDPKGFFNWLIGAGVIEGSSAHYTTKGKLQPWEFAKAMEVAQQAAAASLQGQAGYDPTFGKDFYTALHKMGAIKGNLDYFTSGQVLADPATLASVTQRAGDFFNAKAQGSGPAGPAEGVPEMNILDSPKMKWHIDRKTGLYYAEYQIPGTKSTVLFEANKQQVTEIYGDAGPPNPASINFNTAIRDPNRNFGGDITEMEGKGSWENHFDRVVTLALDQRTLPAWVRNDPAALGHLFMTVTENRSNDWFYEQLQGLPSFKKRYPGLDKLLGEGLTVPEGIKAFTEFELGLKRLHAGAGFNPAAITPNHVGSLLNKNYSLDQVKNTYGVWERIHSNTNALNAFNEILVADGKAALQGKSMYQFMMGSASDDLYEIWEGSAINEAAEAHGFGDIFTGQNALDLALRTEGTISQGEAFQAFQGVAQQALRFRHELAMAQYGLDVDDLIDLSFGQAPRSGKDLATVVDSMQRIQQEAQGFIANRVSPFIQFSDKGKPRAASFGEARQVT